MVDKEKDKEFNVLRHRLVAKHCILSKKEAEDILKKYEVQLHQLPYIRISDPAIRTLDAELGDIIKIERKSSTSGTAVAYRYVIEG